MNVQNGFDAYASGFGVVGVRSGLMMSICVPAVAGFCGEKCLYVPMSEYW